MYVCMYVYGQKNTHTLFEITNISLLLRSFVNVKLQTKIQAIQRHNEFKLKYTYRIKEIIIKDKL